MILSLGITVKFIEEVKIMYELLSTVFDIEDILKVKDAGAT